MNIIKFYDSIIEGKDFWNNYLKGKYAYNVNMKWVFPFEKLDRDQYVALSKGDISIDDFEEEVDYITLSSGNYSYYIDMTATEKANSISKYIYLNNYSTDSDITLSELKKFRTWLATQLLNTADFKEEFIEQHKEYDLMMINAMLNYYKNEMSDSTTKMLSMFVPGMSASIIMPNLTSCGCNTNLNTALTIGSTNVCDPLYIYTNEIYKYMIKCFSNIDFWDNDYLRSTIVVDFKNYIDNIIKANLPLTSSVPNKYQDCTCLNVDTDLQLRYQNMLAKLSQTLQYIIDEDVDGHKNYIYLSLNDWATYLYEKMRW